eukprot:c11334_g2_i2.p1 GENE.c11334_g2_i2~~c11334_g2_i2.p1  ORF type:complete len:119 (+),score=12.01 c11334_g2_i2:188-544(+)
MANLQKKMEAKMEAGSIITCSKMRDIWLHEIGPKLSIKDIVILSLVNKWGRDIAHSIKLDVFVGIRKMTPCSEASRFWPSLRLELALHWNAAWQPSQLAHCRVSSITLRGEAPSSFDS